MTALFFAYKQTVLIAVDKHINSPYESIVYEAEISWGRQNVFNKEKPAQRT